MSDLPAATPRSFIVADLSANGELRSRSAYDYPRLEQLDGAPELIGRFSSLLWRSPSEFELDLEGAPGAAGLRFRWKASADTAGIATLWCGKNLVSISLLATGLNREADAITLQAFQQHLVRLLHDTGYEPSFALIDLLERPLLATINCYNPPDQRDQTIAALADRCFAASYFRYQRLA